MGPYQIAHQFLQRLHKATYQKYAAAIAFTSLFPSCHTQGFIFVARAYLYFNPRGLPNSYGFAPRFYLLFHFGVVLLFFGQNICAHSRLMVNVNGSLKNISLTK